jgi:WD40 repeat protein
MKYRRWRKLVACSLDENRVVIHDLKTGEQKVIEMKQPSNCASSQHFIAIKTLKEGLHLYSTDGVLVHIVPDSMDAICVAFHPRKINILAMAYGDGTVRMWDVIKQAYKTSFKQHSDGINRILFGLDGRLFLSSWDDTASIVTLDDQFRLVSSVKLEGHMGAIFDILPLPISNHCVTCSQDGTLKVRDSETGVCLRTLTEHTGLVMLLAMHPNGQYFASGSNDQSVIIWSSKTFEVLRRIAFSSAVHSLVFGERDTLYAGVYDHGVMPCNALTGKVGPVIIPGTGNILGLSLGKSLFCSPRNNPLTHSHSNPTVPALMPWTSSTHALWPLPAQHIVHMAVVVLWKVCKQYPQMYLPYELVEITLRHA